MDIIFAGGKFRAKSKSAKIAKIYSTRKIGVIGSNGLQKRIEHCYTRCIFYMAPTIKTNRHFTGKNLLRLPGEYDTLLLIIMLSSSIRPIGEFIIIIYCRLVHENEMLGMFKNCKNKI